MFISSASDFRKRCDMHDDLIKKLHLKNWVLLLLLGSFSFVFMSLSFSLGVLAGGLIVTVGFHSLQKILERSLNPLNLGGKALFIKYYLRLFVMGLLIYILISRHYVSPIGLLVGLSVVALNLMFIGFTESIKILLNQGV